MDGTFSFMEEKYELMKGKGVCKGDPDPLPVKISTCLPNSSFLTVLILS